MSSPLPYAMLAGAVLLLHFAIVVFVVGGLLLVLVGNLRRWPWVNGLGFRLAHLVAIGVVVAQAWLGQVCPLTTLESHLRERAGEAAYSASYIEHWVSRVLYYEAPFWVFTAAYSVFALFVVAAWWYFPPRPNANRGRRGSRAAGSPPTRDG